MKHLKEEIEQQGKSQYGRNVKSIILHSFDNKLITYMSNKINDYNYFYDFTLCFFFTEKDLGALRKENRKSMAVSVAIFALLSLGYLLFNTSL